MVVKIPNEVKAIEVRLIEVKKVPNEKMKSWKGGSARTMRDHFDKGPTHDLISTIPDPIKVPVKKPGLEGVQEALQNALSQVRDQYDLREGGQGIKSKELDIQCCFVDEEEKGDSFAVTIIYNNQYNNAKKQSTEFKKFSEKRALESLNEKYNAGVIRVQGQSEQNVLQKQIDINEKYIKDKTETYNTIENNSKTGWKAPDHWRNFSKQEEKIQELQKELANLPFPSLKDKAVSVIKRANFPQSELQQLPKSLQEHFPEKQPSLQGLQANSNGSTAAFGSNKHDPGTPGR